MFTRPQPPLPDLTAGISVAAPLRVRRLAWLTLLKRATLLGLLALGAMVFLANAAYVTSDNAVVTAHVVSLRSPIEGIVQTRIGTVGAPVAAGVRLAEVVNPLADERPVADLRLTVARLTADLTAMRQLRGQMVAILAELSDRVARHREAKRRQLAFDAGRAERDRSAKADALRQLVRDMDRKVALTGTVSTSDIEQATTAVRVAAEQLASLDQQAGAAAAAEQAAAQGVLVEANGGNDVAYSEQRADEVRLRLADLDRSIAAAEADLAQASGRMQVEAAAYDRHRTAILTVPSTGMIWRLGAGAGERVAPGDILAQTVDCGAAYLAVDVAQDRVADIDLTAPATFQLAGEHQDRSGRITAIMGTPAISGDTATAVAPAAGTRPVVSVVIAVPPSPNELGACLVGRTARVRLQATRAGWLSGVRRWLSL
jgi:multidrug resistance efflux pump